jgi:hydrogenase expression/formation protein HypC
MCLGIPGKITEIYEANGLKMGKVDFGGVVRETCLAYVPEAKVGDYTVVHVGFALNLLDEEEALETLALLNEIGELDQELGAGGLGAIV